MNYLLSNHERAYNLSFNEGLLALGTGLSAAPYAVRHWELSNRSAEHCLGHRIIAVLQAIPVIGLLFALIERVVSWFLRTAPLVVAPQQIANELIQKVNLQNARQYDMPGNQPAACTFHAVSAMREISTNFEQVFNWIRDKNGAQLSALQIDVICNKGLPLYRAALAQDDQLAQGADFQQILPHLPAGIRLQQPANHEELQTFNDRLNIVVNHLFAPLPHTKTVWIKNGNEESFAIVSRAGRAIIFDSHKNEIVGTTTQDALSNALREKLMPFSTELGGVDVTPFAYALTAL